MDIKSIWPGWEVVRKIGSGSFGNVYEIERDVFGDKEKAAMKVISIPYNPDEINEYRSQGYTQADITEHYQQCLQQIVKEYSLMAKIKGHPNVVSCEDLQYIPKENGIGWDIYIKMELLCPLMMALDQVANEAQVVKLAKDLCGALVRCKDRNIIHRDIKPQNIFVSEDGTYKLGDFGIAKTVEKTAGGTRIGTPKFMAPEIYNNYPYGETVDIYSLGLVLYWLLNEKKTPFLSSAALIPTPLEEEQACLRRFRGDRIPAPKYGSDELKRIVLKACACASVDRYGSAAEMLEDLKKLSNVSTVPFSLIPVAPVSAQKVAPAQKSAMDTMVLEDVQKADGTMLLEDLQKAEDPKIGDTMLLDDILPAEKPKNAEDAAQPIKPEKQKDKKKAGGMWAVLALAVVGIIIILLLMLKSCDGSPMDPTGTTLSTTKLTTAPTIKPTTKPTTRPTTTPTTTPTTAATSMPTMVPTIELTTKATTQPTTKATTQPTTKATTKPTTKVTTVPTTVSTTKPTTAPKVTVVWDYGFNSQNETEYGIYLEQKTLSAGDIYAPPFEPKRTGFDFYGWYTAAGGQGTKISTSTTVTLTSTHTIYAYWGMRHHTLSFNLNGGEGSFSSRKINYNATYGSVGGDLPKPARPGYTFVGWFTAASGGTQVTQMTKMGDQDVVIYARWEKIDDNPYKLKYSVNKDGSTCTITGNVYSGEKLDIPSSIDGYRVTAIGDYAFRDFDNFETITIPSGVTTIGNYAFYECENLTSITIPGSVTTIGKNAFSICKNLTSITIPYGVTTIGKEAFSACTNIVSIMLSDSVKTIGEQAFFGCSKTKAVNIPASVTSIGDGAFSNCHYLSTITVDSGNQHYIAVDNVLFTKDMERLISCAGTKTGAYQIPNGVINIGEYAFSYSKLTAVSIPNSVTTVEERAFIYSNIKSVIIPGSVKTIKNSAFWNCILLETVTICDGVDTIGERAFGACYKLESVTIPASVTFIGGGVFCDCNKLSTITVNSGNQHYVAIDNMLFTKDMERLVSSTGTKSGTYQIPNGVTIIGEYAFQYDSGLSTIIIPQTVTIIECDAFYHCDNLTNIQFQGTKAQWKAIEKQNYWDRNTGNYTIHCTDGDIPKA